MTSNTEDLTRGKTEAEKELKAEKERTQDLEKLVGQLTLDVDWLTGTNLSKLLHSKYIKPYLLRNLGIVRPDQVRGVDITYILMEQGFMYSKWWSEKIGQAYK